MIALLTHVLALLAMPFLVFERLTPRYRWYARLSAVALVTFVLAIIFTAGIAVGVPENVRHGYPSCAACHIAGAQGGGAVTPYGRSAGAEIMPTWHAPGEEALFGLVEPRDWLIYGGDARYVTIRGSRDTDFFMQREAEIGVQPIKGLTLGTTMGIYGPLSTPEHRRSYAKLALSRHLALRAGRFVTTYGLAFADHRLPTRAGLAMGQGSETLNAEATAASHLGEITITAINGSPATVDSTATGYRLYQTGRAGWAARAALFVGDHTQLGASLLRASDAHAHGIHLVTGSTWWYLLAEWDRRFPSAVDLAAGRVGLEPIQGLQLGPTAQWDGTRAAWGALLTWYPRPHLEITATTDYVREHYERTILLHYYL